jgi:hypothetical protein
VADSYLALHMVTGLVPADKVVAANRMLVDKVVAVGTKPVMDRESPDMVTELYLVPHTDYIDRRVYILSAV